MARLVAAGREKVSITTEQFEQFVEEGWIEPPTPDGKPSLRHLYIMSTGLPGETGEVCELLKKYVRDGTDPGENMKKELGDVLHYLTKIGRTFGLSLQDIMQGNVDKLTDRRARGVVRGSGNDR